MELCQAAQVGGPTMTVRCPNPIPWATNKRMRLIFKQRILQKSFGPTAFFADHFPMSLRLARLTTTSIQRVTNALGGLLRR